MLCVFNAIFCLIASNVKKIRRIENLLHFFKSVKNKYTEKNINRLSLSLYSKLDARLVIYRNRVSRPNSDLYSLRYTLAGGQASFWPEDAIRLATRAHQFCEPLLIASVYGPLWLGLSLFETRVWISVGIFVV